MEEKLRCPQCGEPCGRLTTGMCDGCLSTTCVSCGDEIAYGCSACGITADAQEAARFSLT